MSKAKQLHFSLEGEFITNLARERLFIDKNMDGAIKLLRSCPVSDELSSDEQLILCLQVLHGAASITGTSGTESYGVVYRDDIDTRPSDLSNISQMVTDMAKENDRLRKENQALSSKFAFLAGRLKNYELRQVNEAYYAETGNPMFPDIVIPPWSRKDPDMGSMLESFLAQQRQKIKMAEKGEPEDPGYGWLEPDGTWHPVMWAHHEGWAQDWLRGHMPFKDNPELYIRKDPDGRQRILTSKDVLVYKLGWVLMSNSYQGLPEITRDPQRNLAKAQKKFLYDYFTSRGRHEEAYMLYED